MNILLVDDHELVRHGLRVLLESQCGMSVVGEAADGATAIRLARELHPEIVLMDISMPDMNGKDAARQITSEQNGARVIALSIHSNRQFIVDMFGAGASGYVLKECAFDELVRAIHVVMSGQRYLSDKSVQVVIQDIVGDVPSSGGHPLLTGRECEIVRQLADGRTTKQIAQAIDISPKTVDACRREIMAKLNIHSVAELTKFAVREGITTLE